MRKNERSPQRFRSLRKRVAGRVALALALALTVCRRRRLGAADAGDRGRSRAQRLIVKSALCPAAGARGPGGELRRGWR